MIVVVGSVRGAPGVTSWALLLAAAWPAEFGVARVVLEADPAGGVLGARYGLGVEPGAVALAAGLHRTSDAAAAVASAGRAVADGVWVVPSPEAAEQSRPLWSAAATEVAAVAQRDDGRVWLVDAGRLDESNPSLAFASTAVLTVVVCGAHPEDVLQLPSRVGALRRRSPRVAVLVPRRCPYRTDELAAFAGTDLVWAADVGDDLVALAAAALSGRRLGRSWGWRAVVDTTALIAGAAHTDTVLAGSGLRVEGGGL